MRRAFISVTLLATLATGITAAWSRPPEPRRLEPTSKWVLDYANERCTLLRNFGQGDKAVLLRMDSFGSRGNFRVTLSGKDVPRSSTPDSRGSFYFPGDRDSGEARMLHGTLGKDQVPAVSFNLDFWPKPAPSDAQIEKLSPDKRALIGAAIETPHPEFERAVDLIGVRFGQGLRIELHTGSMGEPLAAMRTCIDDLYKSWGVDPAQQKALSALAVPLPKTVKHVQNEYPLHQLASGANAYVPVRLMVDASGQATSCVVQSADVDADFKHAVCANLQGSFKPALDGDGKPVPSMFHTAVIYLVNGWR